MRAVAQADTTGAGHAQLAATLANAVFSLGVAGGQDAVERAWRDAVAAAPRLGRDAPNAQRVTGLFAAAVVAADFDDRARAAADGGGGRGGQRGEVRARFQFAAEARERGLG